jgi:hypothetical protein
VSLGFCGNTFPRPLKILKKMVVDSLAGGYITRRLTTHWAADNQHLIRRVTSEGKLYLEEMPSEF